MVSKEHKVNLNDQQTFDFTDIGTVYMRWDISLGWDDSPEWDTFYPAFP